MTDLRQTLLDIARCATAERCWLCEKPIKGKGYPGIFGLMCDECGPPEPMGPTESELRKQEEIRDTFQDDERFTEREPESDPQTGWVNE